MKRLEGELFEVAELGRQAQVLQIRGEFTPPELEPMIKPIQGENTEQMSAGHSAVCPPQLEFCYVLFVAALS